MNKGRRGLHGPDDNPMWTQGIASVAAGDVQGLDEEEGESKHKSRQNPVRRQSEEAEGFLQSSTSVYKSHCFGSRCA